MALRDTHRGAKLLALALAAGTTVVAGAGSASAATPSSSSYDGSTGGFALHLAVNLPGNVLNVSETVAVAQGTVTKTTKLTGSAVADLFQTNATGATDAVSSLFSGLNREAKVDLDGQKTASADLVPYTDAAGVAQVAAGNVASTLIPGGLETVTKSDTSSKITNLDLGLNLSQLAAIPGVGSAVVSAVQGAIPTVTSTLTSATGTVTSALATITSALPSAPTTGVAPVDSLVGTVQSTVQSLPAELTGIVNELNTDIAGITGQGGLLHVGLIGTDQTVAPAGAGLTATTISQVGNLSILGGLVNINALKSVATATATGVKGGAVATVDKTDIADVNVGTLASLQATVSGLEGKLAGLSTDQINEALGLPDTSTAVSDLINSLNTILSEAGVQVGYIAADTKTAAADGTSATAATQGIGIKVGLPSTLTSAIDSVVSAVPGAAAAASTGAQPLIELQLVPASASVAKLTAASQGNAAVAPPALTSAPVTKGKPVAPTKKLAYTGAPLALTGGIALSLILVGAAANRRRRSTEI